MKKLIIPLIALVLLTGCSLQYNIKIDKDTINEFVILSNYNKDTWNTDDFLIAGRKYKEKVNTYFELPQPVYTYTPIDTYDEYAVFSDGDYYNKEIISNNKNYGIKYSFKHKIENYGEARIIRQCYENIEVINNKKTFKISTSEEFSCLEDYDFLDDIEINVTISDDYKMISNNADSSKDGKYIWKITKDNADNKPIEIELQKVFNWKFWLIVCGISVVIITIIIVVVKNIMKKHDEI